MSKSKANLLGEAETHPSYGTVMFTRVQGGETSLFGSSLRSHQNTIRLSIQRAKRYHDLGKDWIMGSTDQIVEVVLSPVQFAELLTTMNVGSGVPCTINRLHGESVPRNEEHHVEIDRAQSDFADSLKETMDRLEAHELVIGEILAKKTVNKGDRQMIAGMISTFRLAITSNWPFYLDQFNTATEKVVTAAKSEVDAFVTGVVQRTGLTALESMKGQALISGKTENKEGDSDG